MGSALPGVLGDPPGDVRAYDARTGKMRWIFHIIPHPGGPGYHTWPPGAWKYIGGGADWGGMAVDVKRGLVFVAGGTPSYTFDGADRIGENVFTDCLLALNAETGQLVWYFQAVRHDLWDRRFPAAPALVTIKRNGHAVDAVAQITKSGYVFVFNRETGKPLFPIEYCKVPSSDIEGEKAASTQPFPLLPPPFARQQFSPAVVTDRTPAAHRAVLARLRKLRHGGQFIPPSTQGTVSFPGFDGGGEWGGPAFDPASGILYVNSNEMAWILRLIPRPKTSGLVTGRELYLSNCSSCHRSDLRGSPRNFPPLET
jgi:quinoprotein glucose dehydrogenase